MKLSKMKVTTELIAKYNTCQSRFDNWKLNHNKFNGDVLDCNDKGIVHGINNTLNGFLYYVIEVDVNKFVTVREDYLLKDE